MSSYKFIIVDVFTDQPLAGNPLAVFPEADGLSDQKMQAIAREFNFSETTFVLKPRESDADWRLRCFTPSAEVFGAGHNALGAWWVIASQGMVALTDGMTTLRQELGDRVLPVDVTSSHGQPVRVAMTQNLPTFGGKLDDLGLLADALGLDPSDLVVQGLQPQAVSTGATHFLTPVKSIDALTRVHINPEKLIEIVRPLEAHGCYLFTRETSEAASAAHARAFFPGIGISEDPATGSAAGPLGAYLASKKLIGEGEWIVIEQGDEMNRPSRIEVQVNGDKIQVAGRSATVAEGTLKL